MDNDPLLTVGEVAQRLRVDDTTVRRWIKNGFLEAVELPGRAQRKRVSIRIQQSKLEQALHRQPE